MDRIFFKGVNFAFYARNGYYSSPEGVRQIDKIAALGTPWVCLISTVMQETFVSTRQFRDFRITPSDDELIQTIDRFHKRGVKVMLRPMIECWDGLQRVHLAPFPDDGVIIPGKPFHYWQLWFESYLDLTRHYAGMAERTGCEAYGLDSELNHTLPQSAHWLHIIEETRKIYRGHLTSSFSDCALFDFADRLAADPNCWLFALDSLGCSNYDPATKKIGATVQEMMEGLKPHLERNRRFARIYGKPFYMGECGCASTSGAARLPYFWENEGGYDGQEQSNYLEAVIRLFGREPWWNGMLLWKWDEQNDRPSMRSDPAGDKGFTVDGKPAAELLSRWFRGELDLSADPA